MTFIRAFVDVISTLSKIPMSLARDFRATSDHRWRGIPWTWIQKGIKFRNFGDNEGSHR